jgi:hypothetical protein
LVRSLVDLVHKDDFILDSEYLTTLMVVVPKCVVARGCGCGCGGGGA